VVSAEEAIEPFTISAPPLMVVAPVYALFAVRVVVPEYTLTDPLPAINGANT